MTTRRSASGLDLSLRSGVIQVPFTMTSRSSDVSFRIRQAVPADAGMMVALRRAIREEGDFLWGEADEETLFLREERERIEEWAQRSDRVIQVALVENRVIGWIAFESGVWRKSAHRGCATIGVDVSYRRRGVARALLSALHAWADRQPEIEQISVECLAGNTASLGLFRGAEYREEGRSHQAAKLGIDRYDDVVRLCYFLRERRPTNDP